MGGSNQIEKLLVGRVGRRTEGIVMNASLTWEFVRPRHVVVVATKIKHHDKC